MPALHTAFRLVLESQRDGSPPGPPDHGDEPGPGAGRGETAAASHPVQSPSDRSGHSVGRYLRAERLLRAHAGRVAVRHSGGG